jgi:hypothetical protein
VSVFTIGLGDRVKDRISGFSGIVVARIEWLNYCNRYTIAPELLKDGKPVESQTFDEDDLKVVKASAIKGGPAHVVARTPKRYTGGPPARGISDPRR